MAREQAVSTLVSEWHMSEQAARYLVTRAHSEALAVDARVNALVTFHALRGFKVADLPAGRFYA